MDSYLATPHHYCPVKCNPSNKIKIADEGDDPLGVISETAAAILGGATFYWQDKYLKSEFGGYIYEEREIEEKEICVGDDGEEYTRTVKKIMKLPVLNPAYDESMDEDYKTRAERDEWNIVGLLGQVYVRVDEDVEIGDKVAPKNGGIGTKSDTGYKVMKITTPHDADKGYGVALCLVR
ncbi:peptidase G2 autoproteolytic cleavage domain-containing protein [Bacillus sp. FSL W7-1360]